MLHPRSSLFIRRSITKQPLPNNLPTKVDQRKNNPRPYKKTHKIRDWECDCVATSRRSAQAWSRRNALGVLMYWTPNRYNGAVCKNNDPSCAKRVGGEWWHADKYDVFCPVASDAANYCKKCFQNENDRLCVVFGDKHRNNKERTPRKCASIDDDLPSFSGDLPSLLDDLPSFSGDLPSLSGDLPPLSVDLPSLSGDLLPLSGDLPSLSVSASNQGKRRYKKTLSLRILPKTPVPNRNLTRDTGDSINLPPLMSYTINGTPSMLPSLSTSQPSTLEQREMDMLLSFDNDDNDELTDIYTNMCGGV